MTRINPKLWCVSGLVIASLYAMPATAQIADPDRLEDIAQEQDREKLREAELKKNRSAVQADITRLKRDLVRVAGEAESYEIQALKIEQKLTDLTTQDRRIKQTIYGDKKTFLHLLGALQRVENNPPPGLAISPDDAVDAARAARLMGTLSADLKIRVDVLKADLESLENIRTEIKKEHNKLKANEAALNVRRKSIKGMVSKKLSLEKSISADQASNQKRVAALAAEAKDLKALIRQFEKATRGVEPRLKPSIRLNNKPSDISPRLKPKSSQPVAPLVLPPDTLRFSDARGQLRAPVSGRVSKAYTEARQGMTVTTRPKAQVVAPYTGRIEFAGAFKHYENVVILNVGDGYFILLTGLGDVYSLAGDMVSAGEPLGLMPFNTQKRTELYIEFRKNGRTINPKPWLGSAFAKAG